MQLQGLMLMLFIMVAIPLMVIFANHNMFFIIIALILFITSFKNIYKLLFNIAIDDEPDDDLTEELEDLMNIDMKKFGAGINTVKGLIVVLFLAYCIYFQVSLLLKLVTISALLLQVVNIINIKKGTIKSKTGLNGFRFHLSGIFNIVVIIFTFCNKFIGQRF